MSRNYIAFGPLYGTAFPQRLKEAHTTYQALQNELAATGDLANDHESRLRHASSAEPLARGLGDFLSFITTSALYNEHCPPNPKVTAQQVFDVPEILEMILLKLSVPMVLRVQGLNRQFRDAVLGSIKLKRMLGLEPDAQADLKTVGVWPGFACLGDQGPDQMTPGEATVGIVAQVGSGTFKVGSRCRSMLVCQPPIQEMKMYATCCMARNRQGTPATVAGQASDQVFTGQGEVGLTVGHLLDLADELKAEHADCPNANWRALDEEGNVTVEVVYRGAVKVREDDPAAKRRRSVVESSVKAQQQYQAKRLKMKGLIAAKKNARAAGKKVPTLQEYEAAMKE